MAQPHHPRIILAGSGLTTPIALAAARLTGTKAVAYVYGLGLVAPHPLYRALWLPSIRRLDQVIANSHATAELVESIGVPAKRITVVHPGVEIRPLIPEQQHHIRYQFRKRHSLGNRPVLLSVGRLPPRKGLRAFAGEILPCIAQKIPDVCLLIIGDTPKGTLSAQPESPEQILRPPA